MMSRAIVERVNIDRFGIPTDYRGVNFRSRLEARWAAFFDLVGWRWTYEPFDLGGYIPDFILHFKHKPMLAEVKPLLTDELLKPAQDKIDLSGWNDEALILGSSFAREDHDYPIIGSLGEIFPGEAQEAGAPALRVWDYAQACVCRKCTKLSAHSYTGYYQCRVSGCYEGDHYLGPSAGRFMSAWLEAGNVVQWRPR